MTTKAIAVIAVVAFIAGIGIAGIAQEWRYGNQIAVLKQEHSEKLAEIDRAASAQLADALLKQSQLQTKAAQADMRHTKELTDAEQQNEALRRQYLDAEERARTASADAATARQRLRIQAKCPVPANNVPNASGSSSMGDATSVELSGEAVASVFDLRRALIQDRQKILYLQEYVTEQCAAR